MLVNILDFDNLEDLVREAEERKDGEKTIHLTLSERAYLQGRDAEFWKRLAPFVVMKEAEATVPFNGSTKPVNGSKIGILLDRREVATMLHALRCLQQNEAKDLPDSCNSNNGCEHFADVDDLRTAEIDTLCEAINPNGVAIAGRSEKLLLAAEPTS